MTVRLWIIAALAVAALGCTRSRITLRHPILAEDAAAIVSGLPKAAVLARLGPPDRVEIEPGGSAFEYLYSRTAARALDVSFLQTSFSYEQTLRKVDRLRVSFDRDGAVRYVGVVPADPSTEPR